MTDREAGRWKSFVAVWNWITTRIMYEHDPLFREACDEARRAEFPRSASPDPMPYCGRIWPEKFWRA